MKSQNTIKFHITINKLELDMYEEAVIEKKNEILELLTYHNEINSNEEFNKIKYLIRRACYRGDLELLEIYLNEEIFISTESRQLAFKINKTNKTASLFKAFGSYDNLIVPRTIEHEGEEYLVTSIIGCGYYNKLMKGIEFPSNSAVCTIYEESFSFSGIETISIPPSLKELKEGWCYGANNLNRITISPLNDRFIMKDDKYLLGKSDPKSENYDILLFANRDIKEAHIPSNIKIISSYAFSNCYKLSKAEIPTNSNLLTIGKCAFSNSKITEILIPSNVSTICKYAFSECSELSKVEIPTNSNLRAIEERVFSCTKITQIYISTNLIELKEGWCAYTDKLKKIAVSKSNNRFLFKYGKYLLGKNDSQSDDFDILLFARRDIIEAQIPSNIKIISSYAFSNCYKLSKVEILTNSNLQTIGKFAFSNSNITQIFIPSNVSTICEHAFYSCKQLSKVEISTNSNLLTIGEYAFSCSKITQFFIPSSVLMISKYAFDYCLNLQVFEISEESKLRSLDKTIFSFCRKVIVMIPQKMRTVININ